MKCFALQWSLAWKTSGTNYAKVSELLDRAAPEPGSMVVLPEMFASGFCFDLEAVAEPEDGPTRRFLQAQAARHRIFLIGGFGGRAPDGRGTNLAAVVNPDGEVQMVYQKIHPFSLVGEHEKFAAGEALGIFAAGGLRGAVFICYDLRFPEVFRAAGEAGAELFVVPANWPSARHAHWRSLLIARAIENQAYVLGVNRCGEDPKVPYAGGSILIDPAGEILAEAGSGEEILAGEIDLGRVRECREKFPVRQDIKWSCRQNPRPQ